MSRNREFNYSITPGSPELRRLWEYLVTDCAVHEPICCCAVMAGGSVGPDSINLWFYCNKTKMRRIARNLDRYFGVEGTTQLFDPESELT